jgi:hypothetical protein
MTYKVQIDDQIRDATSAEIDAIEQSQAESKQFQIDKLKALGLSDAEISALVD